ncbi:MAG TPA: hypothetical protein VGZ00_03700 [Candidatus Baltobacteraceae bacterium]|jgi:hypothetical protein|nr:hypothetical protein [Candidatus Baltobacteraceae bacterium]
MKRRSQLTGLTVTILLLALAMTAVVEALGTPLASDLAVKAHHLTFFSDRYLLVGEGTVRLRRPDGTTIEGDYLAMNIRLNRYIIAGHVHLTTKAGTFDGAGFSEFIDQHRIYFLPVTDKPDRWTFLDNDFAHPLLGREMPGDAFELPPNDLGAAYIQSREADIRPHQFIRFTPAGLNVEGVFIPLPDYVLIFSANPNYAQNSLNGAELDAPYPFAGNSNSLSTFHLRYDQTNHAYAAIEEHLLTDRSYLVASINPLTQPQKQYNLLGFDKLSPTMQFRNFAQENTFQSGFSQPLNASVFDNGQLTMALRHSYLQLTADQFYQSLLGEPPLVNGLRYYGDPSHVWIPDHPSDAFLTWTGVDHRVNKTPIFFRLRSGYGFAHNAITPEGSFDGTTVSTIWDHFGGLTLYAPALRLARDKEHRDTSLNVVFDKQRSWFSLPHFVDSQTETASISKTYSPRFSTFVNYSITQTEDNWGAAQSTVYPPPAVPVSPITGQSYPGYTAFRGFATTRSLVEGLTFTTSPNVSGSMQMRENHDFPEPIPGPTSPAQIGGASFQQLGVAPYQATLDLRVRLNPNLLVDLTRSYFFGFGNQSFSPQFQFLLSQ